MTADQIDLVVDSFADILRRRQDAGMVFYHHLFEIAPDLRLLFKNDIQAQSRKLIDTLATAVGSLHDLPALSVTLRHLGERHRTFGVRRQDYLPVGKALVLTLQAALGDRFDAKTRDAWVALYREVSSAMIAGAGYSERRKVA